MLVLNDLQQGDTRKRYSVFQFQFSMYGFFVFLNICKACLYIHKASSPSLKKK